MHIIGTNLGEITRIYTGELDVNAGSESGKYPFFTCGDETLNIDYYAFDTEAILLAGNGNFGVKHFSGKFNAYQRTYIIEPKLVDGRWLFYAVKFNIAKITQKSRGSTIKYLRMGDIKECPITLVPLNEQHRIVEKIDSLFAQLDKGEAALRQVQTQLERYRQSVLKAAVTGELTADWRANNAHRLESGEQLLERILATRRDNWQGRGKYKEPAAPDTTNLPALPEGWVWASLEQTVAEFRNGLSKKPTLKPNGYPILRISAVRPMSVVVDDLRYYEPKNEAEIEDSWVRSGDLLFTRYNGSARFVGVCGQYRKDTPVLYPDKLIKAQPIQDLVSADFLEIAWNVGQTRAHIASHIKTTSGQQGIAGRDIKSAPFPLPPLLEQREIVSQVSDLLETVKETERACQTELARSQSLRQSILREAFAGRLVAQDPNDEPASELLARIRAEQEQKGPAQAGRAPKQGSHSVKARNP